MTRSRRGRQPHTEVPLVPTQPCGQNTGLGAQELRLLSSSTARPETVNFISELAFCRHVGPDGGGACWRRGTPSASLPPFLARSHVDSETPSTQNPGAPEDKLASAQDSLRTQKASSGVLRNTDKGGPVTSFLIPTTSPNSPPPMLNDDREGEGAVGRPEFLSLGPTYPSGSRRRAWWDVSASRSETEQRLRRRNTDSMYARSSHEIGVG